MALSLPDLPDEEPWYELKFQLRELHYDLISALEALRDSSAQLAVKEKAGPRIAMLRRLYVQLTHDTEDHSRRALELADHLLTHPPEEVPVWKPGEELSDDHGLPPEVLACTSLNDSGNRLAWHLEQLALLLDRAHQSVLRAAEARGSRQEVLTHIQREALHFHELLQSSLPHAQNAYRWARQHWRLVT